METVAPLFTALISLALAISTLIRGGRDRLHQEYAFLAGVVSTVFLCLFFHILTKEPAWRYGLLLSALLIAPAAIQVHRELLPVRWGFGKRLLPALYAAAAVQLGVIVALPEGSPIVIGCNGLVVFGGMGLCAIALERNRRELDRTVDRQRLGSLLILGTATIVLMVLEIVVLDWNHWRAELAYGLEIPFPPLGSLAAAAYIWFLEQVVLRQRLLDGREMAARFLVVVSLAAFMGIVYALIVRLVGPGDGLFAEAVNVLIASILVLTLYDPLRQTLERRMARLLSRRRWQWHLILQDLRRRLPAIIEVEPMIDALLDPVVRGDQIDLISLYLYDDDRGGLRLRRWVGEPEHALLPAVPQRPYADGFIDGRRWYLLADLEVEGRRGRRQTPVWLEGAMATMQALQAEVSIPLQIGSTVVGLWNLRLRPGADGLSEEELHLLRDLADQAAVLIDNSRAFERLKERDRLAALGEMSAGLAHEIRNPLGAIKGAVQVLSRGPHAQNEWLGIIVEEVDRLNGVVGQFLDYARPMKVHAARVRPELLVRGVAQIVEAEGLPPGVQMTVDHGEGVPEVSMDIEQLKQVVLNLARNAVESMAGKGGVLRLQTGYVDAGPETGRLPKLRTGAGGLSVKLRRGELESRSWVEIIVSDQGVGMRPEDGDKLFIPFFTTKERGTGLGLAISERIVRQHGGEIEVESTLGVGTRFVVRLGVDPAGIARAEPAV